MMVQIQRQIKGILRHSGWTQDGGSFESETGTYWGLTDIAAATTFLYHLDKTSGQGSNAQIPGRLLGWGSTRSGKVASALLGPRPGEAPNSHLKELAGLESSAGRKR